MKPTSKLNNTGKEGLIPGNRSIFIFRDKMCMKGLLIMTILDFK